MGYTENLHIAVHNVNAMLAKLTGGEARLRESRSYGTKRLYIDEKWGASPRDTPPRGPKECLMFAEGMERALGLLYYGREES